MSDNVVVVTDDIVVIALSNARPEQLEYMMEMLRTNEDFARLRGKVLILGNSGTWSAVNATGHQDITDTAKRLQELVDSLPAPEEA